MPLAELDDLSKTEVFISAAAEAGVGQIKTLAQFASNPVETVKGIPSGIGRMFTRFKRQTEDAVDTAQEMVADDEEEGTEGEASISCPISPTRVGGSFSTLPRR